MSGHEAEGEEGEEEGIHGWAGQGSDGTIVCMVDNLRCSI